MSRPERLLELARGLLTNADPATAGLWPRASPFLARQALEEAIADVWRRVRPEMLECSQRAQLLALGEALEDRGVAARARHAWTALSRACHHHPYELGPSEPELSAWLEETGALLRATEDAAETHV